MRVLAIIIIMVSLAKLYIAGNFERYELSQNLFYSIKNNLNSFQKNIISTLLFDSIIGLLCGIALLL